LNIKARRLERNTEEYELEGNVGKGEPELFMELLSVTLL
jgi:hypothetical protein